MVKETMTQKERIEAAINLEPYDRVPVAPLGLAFFAFRQKGLTLLDAVSSPDGGFQPVLDLFDEIGGWDAMADPGASRAVPPKVSSVGGYWAGKTLLPGIDLPEDSVPQYAEEELLTVEDYDSIIKLGWNGFVEKHLDRFSDFTADQVIARAQKSTAQYVTHTEAWDKLGVPVLSGATVNSPLMLLSLMRSLTPFTMDLYRIPDKVQAVMDAIVDELIEDAIEVTRLTGIPAVMLVLERGGGFYYPLSLFERFEFPYMKKMTEAFAARGIISILHFDTDWILNLPYLKDLPKKMCICELDSKTDMFKAKEILKDHMCIMGDVPASLFTLGTPEEMEDYCRKLIDVVGKDTGLILSSGCLVPIDCKFENFKAMIDTSKHYYPHGVKGVM
jgi:uroporphyrinogen-III decarboxylase